MEQQARSAGWTRPFPPAVSAPRYAAPASSRRKQVLCVCVAGGVGVGVLIHRIAWLSSVESHPDLVLPHVQMPGAAKEMSNLGSRCSTHHAN